MDIAICCIVKMENLYLRDFIEYHKNLGVTHVFLYDNNDENGEYPQQVIGDYIDDGYITYIDVRGKYRCQLECYTECYNTYKNDYDWIAFIDIDEFICLYEDDNLADFLSRDKFNDVSCIFLYWVQYGDSELLHYDRRPVYERFTEHIDQEKNYANTFKMIVKGKTNFIVSFMDANAFTWMAEDGQSNVNFIDVNAEGERIGFAYVSWTYKCAVLNHYQTLTIDEFLCRRFGRRAYADKASSFNKENVMGIFWSINSWTPKKQEIVDKFFSTYNIAEDNV